MRCLIVNADGLGVNSQRSHGIFQYIEFGVVRSASLVANGTDSDLAARHARERKVPTGLHLNLTSEFPVSKPEDVRSLLHMSGRFLDRERLRSALDGAQVDPEHLSREIRAQVEWFLDAHGSPTHLDSYEQVHIHPAIVHALLPILDRYGIRFVRIPREEPLPPYGYIVTEERLAAVRLINAEALTARELFSAHGIASTEHFRGATLLGNASLKNMRHILTRLPEGTTELMVHPGSLITYGTPFDLDPQRQTELRMLMDPTVAQMIVERKIHLCSWGDI